MKNRFVLSFLLAFTICFSGCGSQKPVASYAEDSVLNYCDDSVKDIFSRKELPKTMVLEQIGETYTTKTISDETLIRETMDAIREMDIICEIDADTQDSSETYIFTMENGDRCMISFWKSDLETIDATFATASTDAFADVRTKIIQASVK